MSRVASRFIEPGVLAGIRDLRLIARLVVDGFLSGVHRSPRPGAGIEFSQLRGYEPGDDLRRVDWKMYARADRFYVRESEVERVVSVRLILDASGSMAHAVGAGVSKFDYARFLAAALGYLAERQGDLLQFQVIRDGRVVLAPAARPEHRFAALIQTLERLTPSGVWPAAEEFRASFAGSRGREVVVLITDLHEAGSEIVEALGFVRSLKHEVLALRLLARDELDFDYQGDLVFEELETGRTVEANAAALRPDYLRRLAEQRLELTRELSGRGVALQWMPTDQPLDLALKSFLSRRR